MGLQKLICLTLCFSRLITVKFCVLLRTGSSKTQMPFLKKNMFQEKVVCFVVDSSRSPHRLHLTFVAFCILSVIRKQYVKKYNYYVDQSELLARFRTDFTSSVWNFFC